MRALAIAALWLVLSGPARADEIKLYAAGVLRAAMTEAAGAFNDKSGQTVSMNFGSSGLFRERIIGGETPHIFASANLEHARAVQRAGKSGAVVVFARNRLCALSRSDLKLTSASLIETLRKPNVRVATLTPIADPAGDLAFAMFGKAERLNGGGGSDLQEKAIHPTGGASEDQPPSGRNVYAWFFEQGRVDVFLTYCSSAAPARVELSDLTAVEMPSELFVAADLGLTVLKNAPPAAYQFALFILSPEGQTILARHGFTAPFLPSDAQR